MRPKRSLQEDLEPPSYMIAQEEILEEPRDTMSQNISSLGSRGASILEEGSNTHGLRDLLDRKRQKEEG